MTAAHGALNRAIQKAHDQNLADPSLANCTKVVRLFVVSPGTTQSVEVERIVRDKSPTRADVFVVTKAGKLQPMTWLGGGLKGSARGPKKGRRAKVELTAHKDAHDEHRGTVVVLKGIDREQIEWQCDVPFRITRIERVSRHTHGFHSFPSVEENPRNPFEKDLTIPEGGPCEPIRSGPTTVMRKDGKVVEWKQLYKAHFVLKIGGVWKPLDPDVYCEWR